MKTYAIYEAKTNFSQLVRMAASGERILIGSHGKPTVELVAVADVPKPKSLLGIWKGKFELPADWDDMDKEIAYSMNNSVLDPD